MRKSTFRVFASALLAALCMPLLANNQSAAVSPLTKELKTQTIDELNKEMKAVYLFTDLTGKVEQDLDARNAAGEYDSITDGSEFAKKLT
jgi:hypothetical protein